VSGTLEELLSSSEYSLPDSLRNTIQYAIALSSTGEISAVDALRAIRRHLMGFGVYGGFPTIVPMHGGGGELSQAFCRAAAVKGATYILGREIQQVSIDSTNNRFDHPVNIQFNVPDTEEMPTARCKNLVRQRQPEASDCVAITRTVTAVEGIFHELLGAEEQHGEALLIIVPPGVVNPEQHTPVQMIIHGDGIGECPQGQCTSTAFSSVMVGIIYCSTQASGETALEYCSRAQEMIIEQITGKTDKSA
jgi:Rab proteins geranylgeranyltransferase component A